MEPRPSRVLMPAEVHRHSAGTTERLAELLGTKPAVGDGFGASIVLPPGVDARAAVEALEVVPEFWVALQADVAANGRRFGWAYQEARRRRAAS